MSRRDIASWSGAVAPRYLSMRLIGLVLVLLAGLCSPQLWAATCSSVFPASITENSPNQLNLSGLSWQNTPALGASNRSLGAGDHYFGGGGTFNDWALAATGGASTRVFVNGSLSIANNSELNAGGNPEDLILVVNGSLSLGNNAVINGFVYVTGSISFGNNLQLDGAITAAGSTNTPGGSTSLNYNDAAIDLADFGSLCSPAIELRLSWSLDEAAWTGAAGEVFDSSANAFNGTAFNGATTSSTAPALATVGGLGSCAYGDFDSAASQYVQRAHNSLLTLQDSFTIGLWVKPETLPASGLMSIVSKDENYEFHLKPNGTVNWWWQTTGPTATREFDSSVALTPGQWSHVLIRFAPGDQRIYINGNLAGQASFSGTPRANSDHLQLGADQNFAGRYFNGQMDELRIYSGALSEAAISALVTERHACTLVQIDHFDFAYANPALTCSPQQVTVRACMNADCSTLYTDPVDLTLAPNSGWTASAPASVAGNLLSFTGGSAVLQLRNTTVGQIALGVQASTPTTQADSELTCSTVGCLIDFLGSGFIFDVPTLLANEESADIGLFAVRKDDTSEACVPAFESGTRTLQFWSDYSDPNSGTRSVQVNGTPVAGSAPGSDIDLTFGTGAQATIRVHYADAGLMSLNARYAPTSGDEAGLVMSGSDLFVSKPLGLCVYSDSPNSDCASGDASCSAFVAAGDGFSLRVRGATWESDVDTDFCDNGTTPNYRQSGIPLASTLIAPAGGAAGALGTGSLDIVATDLGEAILTGQSLSEVGVFTISATPAINAYFGETVGPGTSANLGRFYPASFDLADPSLTPACGISTYAGLVAQPGPPAQAQKAGQTFPFSGSLSALNRGGAITRNYTGDFAKLNGSDIVYGDPGAVGIVAVSGTSLNVPGSDGVGHVDYSANAPSFLFNAPSGPYNLAILTTATDSDGVTGSVLDAETSDFRLGQARIGNAHGSELQDLAVPFTAAYFTGSGYAPNPLDSCSDFAAVTLGAYQPSDSGSGVPALAGGSYLVLTGLGNYQLIAPGPDSSGSMLLTYAAPTWLQFDWNGDGALDDPSGLATFGIYRGAAPLIFRRELYR